MALDNKYRVHEVAKDFGVSTKEITEILTKYRSAPKNHMQVLDVITGRAVFISAKMAAG